MQLWPQQQVFKNKINDGWASGHRNMLGVSATGSGKTVVVASIVHDHHGPSCSVAHRQELVSQISLALAREKLKHRIIGPRDVISEIVREHTEELGQSWYDPAAPAAVAGVDTLNRRADALADWCKSVTLWVQDEAHHVLDCNKWGKAISLFPNARGLGVTATPCRSDGAGLGRHADGVFDLLVESESQRWHIDNGYLTDYRIFAPPSDLIMDENDVGAKGDWSTPKMRAASQKSKIVGDVVKHYLRIAPGKKGVTFATDVDTARDIADQFNAAGVPAAVVHAKTKNRSEIIKKFRRGEYLMLVNVDIFGEGFDLPAIEVVIMARPTMSYSLYAQQFGRALRIMAGKQYAIIIDHVGNVMRHGLPDRRRVWTLDRREKKNRERDPDVIPTRTCQECLAVYEAIYVACPYCHHVNEPAGRSRPELVDGDLFELDPATLAAMRNEIDRIDAPAHELRDRMKYAGANPAAIGGAVKNHEARQEAQRTLRDCIALWAGYQRQAGRPDSESYRRFYFRYGVDVATAQTLGKREADELCQKIADDLLNITI